MRLLGSFFLALLVALALFGLMLALVMPPERVEQPEREVLRIGVTRSVADTPSERNQPQQAPERPTPPQRPRVQPPTPVAPPLPTPTLKIEVPQLQSGLTTSAAPAQPVLEPAAVAAAPSEASSNSAPQAAAHGAPESDAQELVALNLVEPEYPERAQRAGIEGTVTLQFVVNAEGRVENIRVLSSEPPGVFDRAARRAVSRSRFVPRQENGIAVAREATKEFQFVLPGRH